MNIELVINRKQHQESRICARNLQPLLPNQVLIKIEKFGFTANNITYVALGESYEYFKFFPAQSETEAKIPVWGIGMVVETSHPQIHKGELIYGYFPMSKYITFSPIGIQSEFFFVERNQLPKDRMVYNQYFRQSGDSNFPDKQYHDLMIIYRPLWTTSFFLHDYLQHSGFFQAKKILVSSASSKTAYCFALLIKQYSHQIAVLGLTSVKNMEYVKSLGFYTEVVSYDNVENYKPLGEAICYIDFAGSDKIDQLIVSKFGDLIQKKVVVGLSHSDGTVPTSSIKFKNIETFFAPGWVKSRLQSSERDSLLRRRGQAWNDLLTTIGPNIKMRYLNGGKSVQQTYDRMLKGQYAPNEGYILSLSEESSKL